MWLVVILGRGFSGADLLARTVSESLRCRLIEEETLMKKATAWGFRREHLRNAVQPIPTPRCCLPQDIGAELVAMRAALADEAVVSEAVFYGCEGFLLPRHAIPVLRIRLKVPLSRRIAEAKERLQLTYAMARDRIRRDDLAYRRWVRRVSGSDEDDPALYDLVISVDNDDFGSAAKVIAEFAIRQNSLEAGPECRAAMADFALNSRIEAVLKVLPHTAGLNIIVRADRGMVFLAARRWLPSNRAVVGGVVSLISGVRRVELVELHPRARVSAETLGKRKAEERRRWIVIAAACGLFAIGGVFFKQLDLNRVVDSAVAGVITDTQCAGNHPVSSDSERGECVRFCVNAKHEVKYALLDGTRVYTLNDQSVGKRFAAQVVTITGRLDAQHNLLEVHSIKLASARAKSLNF